MLYKWGTYQLIHAITERNMQTFNPLTITFYYFMNNNIRWEKSIKYKINKRGNDEPTYFNVYIMMVKDMLYMNYRWRIQKKIEDLVTTVVNNDALVGDEEYISLVYQIAIEKLNEEKTDLRKLQVDEDQQMEKFNNKLENYIQKWYHFWIKSQGVNEGDNYLLFKWWGMNDNINFGSGMDDWPRSHNGLKSKFNIDASMWGWLIQCKNQLLFIIHKKAINFINGSFSPHLTSWISQFISNCFWIYRSIKNRYFRCLCQYDKKRIMDKSWSQIFKHQ